MGRTAGKDDRPAGNDRRLAVDDVPDVPGIGPKTAAQLLEQFGDLDTLLARAGEIKQDKRARIQLSPIPKKARASRASWVTLKNDVPVTDGLDDFVLHAPDGPKLIGFLKNHGIHLPDPPRGGSDQHRDR